MGKYLKKFETQAAYEAAQSGLLLPNVSLTVDNNTVHYNPYDPYNGHEYIDLGLPSGTKWAKMNVGANSETDYGYYYMYGKGARDYHSSDPIYEGEEEPLALSADTASQVMGGLWHTPTKDQFEELFANTNFVWTRINGKYGSKLVNINNSSQYLFFPAAGIIKNGNRENVNESFFCWYSAPHNSNNGKAYGAVLNNYRVPGTLEYNREYGISIRGVVNK